MGQYCNTGEKCAYLWSPQRTIEVKEFSPEVTMQVSPLRINGPGDVDILFTATNPDGSARQGLEINVGAAAGGLPIGSFVGYTGNPVNGTTGPDGLLSMTLHLDPIADEVVITGTFDDDCPVVGVRTLTRKVRYIERPPWIQPGVSVGWSCPLVADLTGDGIPEVAVISRARVDYTSETYSGTSDGRIYVWSTNGDLLWTSKDIYGTDLTIDEGSRDFTDYITTGGDNTLSAADLDNRGGLELVAPAYPFKGIYAYGYDGATFKPLAGWPVASVWAYDSVAAALGDTNLDGTTKVVAGDLSCLVGGWNACGDTSSQSGEHYGRLWQQFTNHKDVDIRKSTPAIGDVHKVSEDSYGIPDVVLGSKSNSETSVWGFAGNEWYDYYSFRYLEKQWRLTDLWKKASVTTGQSTVTASDSFCSPVIDDIDLDGTNDVVIGDNAGYIWMWLSTNPSRDWQCRKMVSDEDTKKEIWSAPVIANLDGQPCVVFGCNNGKVYAVRWHSATQSIVDAAGWEGGILLREGTRPDPEGGFMGGFSVSVPFGIRSSPIIGNVITGTSDIQVIVGCIDGTVYALWKDGRNHASGPDPARPWLANEWRCAQYPVTGDPDLDTRQNTAILSTPTLCSFDNGTTTAMIVGTTDGIYKIDFPDIPFNSARHPWPTFHYNAARTGCPTTTSGTAGSASIVGRIKTSGGVGIEGASIRLEYWTGSVWSSNVPIHRRAAGHTNPPRPNPILSAGTYGTGNEINEGGFVFNQLTPNTRYRLIINGNTSSPVYINNNQQIPVGRHTQDVTW